MKWNVIDIWSDGIHAVGIYRPNQAANKLGASRKGYCNVSDEINMPTS